MGKRVVCLICAGLLLVAALFSVRTWAQGWDAPRQALPCTGLPNLAKGIVKHSPNPLASAMLLVLAGVALSMLFDKKNKR
ncbi:MAG: hypothetical protein PUK18_02430 [Firmicutes bacterium]|nr:hypothetical protein [Bacillota bacterium]MDY6159296.1 hypothetical protein [Candidatus Faecousia sp.]